METPVTLLSIIDHSQPQPLSTFINMSALAGARRDSLGQWRASPREIQIWWQPQCHSSEDRWRDWEPGFVGGLSPFFTIFHPFNMGFPMKRAQKTGITAEWWTGRSNMLFGIFWHRLVSMAKYLFVHIQLHIDQGICCAELNCRQ